ncbi:MAG: DUF1553 domain-containing protein [Planctomycetota bacterium]|nr:MAG: DUF1553 domain-containing protein [Planctomycetota bacterium]
MRAYLWAWGLCLLGTVSAGAADPPTFTPEQVEYFETHVRPLLVEHCQKCHGTAKQQAGLRLDSRMAALAGGDQGPALIPGNPTASLLLTAIKYTGDTQMPPAGKLAEEQIASLEKWIAMGAPWPATVSLPDAERIEKQRKHWAFQPVKPVEIPSVTDSGWCRTPVDQFVLQRLERQQLSPTPAADRRTLIRRVTYDLTGLPPTPEEVEAFVQDQHPEAYRQLVERLLASPQYGEQWARHWLDVARYSDTKGYVYGREERVWVHAPTYRDWVVRAMNEDMPYDRFLALQIAADQIAPGEKAHLAAMGFLTLNRRFLGVTHDIYDDRIDVITRGTMALTVACARCHDHKYDPIPTTDYYSLYGVFLNSREQLTAVEEPGEKSAAYLAFETDLSAKQTALADAIARKRGEAADRVRSRLKDYLVAQTELHKAPQEGFDIIIATTDLVPAQIWRIEAYIAGEMHGHNPVFVPWKRFAALPVEPFAARAAETLQTLTADTETPSNPLVVQALTPPPTSMREVTERYAQLLTDIDGQWKAALKAAVDTGMPAPTQLSDPSAEALRQVLYGPASPCEIPNESIVSTELLYDSGTVNELWKLQNDVDRVLMQNPLAPRHTVILQEREALRPHRVLRRGNPAMKTDFVSRHFLSLVGEAQPTPFTQGSGRRELAESLIAPTNPLTARVWVNRLWQHHFGIGLVRTPSDFGIRAEDPSHPELLDWLASQLMTNGWSTKTIHRLIVLSDTYQQRSDGPVSATVRQRAQQLDPDNRLLWRMNIHRLSWEEFRDTLLTTTGQLDRQLGGRSSDLFAGNGSTNHRRTLYGTVDRQFLPSVLRMFDFANPDLHIPARSETTVPQQALFAMNHPLMAEKSRSLVAWARLSEVDDPVQKLERLFRSAYQRPPTSSEREAALAFVTTEVEPPPPSPSAESKAWSYGYGEFDETSQKPKSFTPLPFFNGTAWQGSVSWPDAALGWVQITARGGHPGNDLQHASIRRWTAPRSGSYSITSKVIHEVAAGDGIRCWIVASRGGILAKTAIQNRTEELNVPSVILEAGDTLDFIVDIHAVLNSDQHFWAPAIQSTDTADSVTWNAQNDFTGPAPILLTTWEQLAQVLLLSNELMFID